MTVPAAKPFYATLDLLRGVAALVVVLYHQRIGFNMLSVLTPLNVGGHGYLAVDFFFQLSGFIIAASYDDRLRRGMSIAMFARVRLVRLYPLIFASLVVGFFAYTLPSIYAVPNAGRAFVKELFFIPTYSRGSNVFPLNFPLWSIIFELVVNLFMAVCFRWLTNRRLIAIVLTTTVVTVSLSIYKGTIDFGAGYPGFPAGLPRTVMSFFAGVLMYRFLNRLPAYRISPVLAAIILLSTLLAPTSHDIAWLYDALAVLVVFPLVIIFSATTSHGTAIDRALGAISYPIYVVHAPTITVCVVTGTALGFDSASTEFGLFTILVVVIAAILALKVWDEPVRRALQVNMRRPNQASQ